MKLLRSWRRRTWAVGLLVLLSMAGYGARASVTISQSPLIIQLALPANLVLMLDDSGSMAWDYMPDKEYLTDPVGGRGSPTTADYIAYNVNGTYYNPAVTYTPPPTSTGTSYPSATFPTAYKDGFKTGAGTADVTSFSGSYPYYTTLEFTRNGSCPTGSTSGSTSTQCAMKVFWFNSGTGTSSFGCPSGASFDAVLNVCVSDTQSPYNPARCATGYTLRNGVCKRNSGKGRSQTPTYCVSGYSYSTAKNYPGSVGICYLGAGKQATTFTRYYTTYYVADDLTPGYAAAAAAVCAENGPNCYVASDTSGAVAPAGIQAGQNVANWFQYYHTRILMAKSGLMSAFSGLDSAFRVGFGSINGNNTVGLPPASYAFSTSTNSGNKLAQVQAFGDGSSGTQKANFWAWLSGERANGSTPLRQALHAVGSYYTTDQPWNNSSSDSTQYSCRQSFAILTTDGFWNEGSSCASGDCVGNADDAAGSTVTGANGQSYAYAPIAPYQDSFSDTLADVAMHFWVTDLRPGLTNDVPVSVDDPAFWQHMSTFGIGMGFQPIDAANQPVTWEQASDCAINNHCGHAINWPQPTSANQGSIFNITDLLHAGVNGHGGFYSAKSPSEFTAAIKNALTKATSRNGTGASLAANSATLNTGSTVFQVFYHTLTWWGDLQSFDLNADGSISDVQNWNAATQLLNDPGVAAVRSIWTSNGSAAVAFTAANAGMAPMTGMSASLINYLRGDNSLEGSLYRARSTALGDIVNSQPVYVGAPDLNTFYGQSFSGSGSYAAFAAARQSRMAMVYVAANDGMLHAFDASSGREVYAYLPAAVIASGALGALASAGYGSIATPHQFINDGLMSIADVYDRSSASWRTLLVGSTGRGQAKAVYALDVTDPAHITPLWERSALDGKTNSNFIGQTVGQPLIVQTANGSWSVLAGNGYNSAANVAALLQFDAFTGALSVHPVADATSDNGLAAPESWISTASSGISDMAYAGDLRGQVWAFPLASPTSTGALVFTAKDASGNRQPITSSMLASREPDTGNVWLFFGTGKYLTTADLTDSSTQTWYGIIVQSGASSVVGNLSNGRSSLVRRSIVYEQPPQTVTSGTTTTSLQGQRAFTPTPVRSDMAGKSGWYIDLVSPTSGSQGERMVLPNQFQGSVLIGTSRMPQATDVCNPTGQGWIMALNPYSGTNVSSTFFNFNAPQGNSVTVEISDVMMTLPVSGVGSPSVPNAPIFVGNKMLTSYDNATTSSTDITGSAGVLRRVFWHRLVNP